MICVPTRRTVSLACHRSVEDVAVSPLVVAVSWAVEDSWVEEASWAAEALEVGQAQAQA